MTTTQIAVCFDDGDYYQHPTLDEARADVAHVQQWVTEGKAQASDYLGMKVCKRWVDGDETGPWEDVSPDEVSDPPLSKPWDDLLDPSPHDPNRHTLAGLDRDRLDTPKAVDEL